MNGLSLGLIPYTTSRVIVKCRGFQLYPATRLTHKQNQNVITNRLNGPHCQVCNGPQIVTWRTNEHSQDTNQKLPTGAQTPRPVRDGRELGFEWQTYLPGGICRTVYQRRLVDSKYGTPM